MAGCSKDELERRLALACPLAVCGVSTAAICAQLAGKGILVGWPTAERYAGICRECILALGQRQPAEARAESLTRRELIFRRAFAAGDERTAPATLDSIDRLWGCYREPPPDERDEIRHSLDALDGGEADASDGRS